MTYTTKQIKGSTATAVLDSEWLAIKSLPDMTVVKVRYRGKAVLIGQCNSRPHLWFQLVVPQK